MKKVGIVIIITLSLLLGLSSLASATDIVDSGTCGAEGDNLTWTLDSEGTLTISGEGAMEDYDNYYHYTYSGNDAYDGEFYDYSWHPSPWYSFSSSIVCIVICEGVTSIGCDAFNGHYYDVDSFLDEFEYYEGGEAYNLTSVTIPNSISVIGEGAFNDCKLSSVYINSLSNWCSISFGDNPLCYAENLYVNNSIVNDLIIPNDVTSIGDNAFCGYKNLTSVTIPDSVTSIGDYTFEGCTGLREVYFPTTLTAIGNGAFADCNGLTDVYYNGTDVQWSSIIIGEENTELLLCLPQNIILYSGTCGAKLTWTLDSDGVLTISGTGPMANYINVYGYSEAYGDDYATVTDSSPWYYLSEYITKIVICEGVTSIGSNAFNGYFYFYCTDCNGEFVEDDNLQYPDEQYDYSNVTSLIIPNSIISIGDYAFKGCSGLTSITIPNSVTSIGQEAFYYCSSLTSVNIPYGITSIEQKTFSNCSSLTNITIPNSVGSIGDKAFEGCSGLTSVKIPSSVTSIGDYVFRYCYGLTSAGPTGSGCSIQFGWTRAIPANAFEGCGDLTNIRIPNSVTSIGSYAFHGCGLTSIEIPDSVTSIGRYAFRNCSGLTGITIPDNVTSLNDGVFRGCCSLQSVDLPAGIASIGKYAFYNCSGLQNVYFDGTGAQWEQISIGSYNAPLENASIIYKDPLCITEQPVDFYGYVGSTITFNVGATGNGLTYQWYCKKPDSTYFTKSTLSSGTKATYTMTMADRHDGYQYYCIVTDYTGSTVRSDTVTVHKVAPLTITTQPADFTGIAGDTIRFTVAASGDGLTYQWYFQRPGESAFNKSTMASGTKATYTMKMADKYDGYKYYCIVSDAYGRTAQSSTVTVHNIPSVKITTQPQDFSGFAGNTLRFTVKASGTGLTYQWYCRKTGETSFAKSTLSSATKATLTMTLAERHDGYQYYCIVTDAYGRTAQSNTVTVHLKHRLQLTSQPTDYTGTVGSTVRFTVGASGDGLTYQWYYKKTDATSFVKSTLASGTKATYTMTMADRHDGWQYYCIVSDAYGNSAVTDTVTVYKAPALTITGQPVNYTGAVGSTVKFTVKASGDGLTYQWYVKKIGSSSFVKSTLASGTKATYSMTMKAKHDGWKYYCIVKDAYGNSIKTNTVSIHLK